MAGILEGIKVLDLTRIIAGPLCTQILADMGATVYKIEKPGEGDDTRRMGPFVHDPHDAHGTESATYLAYNRGKQSVTIDIATPEGAALVQDLAARCDVVVQNYKVGALAKYGLDEASLRRRRPDIIYCSVTGFGTSGPYAARPAYDFILQGMAGVMSTCGHPDGEPGAGPMRTAIPITDVVTGLYAAIGVIGALYHRQNTGQGQHLDTSLLDSAVSLNGHLALGYLITGKVPARVGNCNPIASPSEVLNCADGPIIVAAGNDNQFKAMCEALGHPEWAQDERFRTNTQRILHRAALREVLTPELAHRTRPDLLATFENVGVPCGAINDMADVFRDEHIRHQKPVVNLPHGRGVSVPSLRNPLHFSATPVEHRAPPMLGEHSARVLAAELGLSQQRLQELRARAVI